MVAPAAGKVVLVPFPFSDLSQSKLRPAIVLADAGRADWILCQVTSKPYGDAKAILLENGCFESGSLRVESYMRPGKLFPAHQSLIVSEVGYLKEATFRKIIDAIVALLKPVAKKKTERGGVTDGITSRCRPTSGASGWRLNET